MVVVSLISVSVAEAGAPENLKVLGDSYNGVAANRLLKNYLLDQTRPHFAARKAAIDAIKTPEQFAERQKWVRRELARINGPFPEKTPLNGQTTGKIQRDGYVIEKVIYESRPGHHVTANLYLPNGNGKPVPGVLVPCGHSKNGKASEAYQSIAISLAKNGMAVLVYDPIGQGERHQVLDDNGKPLVQGTTEHTLEGVGGWLVGTGTANYRIWDGIRSIDYLISRPEVDGNRIGCTGNSGGGTMTSYLMAFDRRITAAAPSCYLTTLERLFDTIGPQDAEQNFPGQVALGIDHADYIAARAPLPTLMCIATQDFFDRDGAWTTFQEAKKLYGLLGHSEKMDIIEFDDTHGFSRPRRQAAMRFMRRWLLDKDDNPEEPELTLCTDEELQCTQSGEVLADFKSSVSVFDLNQQRATDLASQRSDLWNSKEKAFAEVRRLTGIREVKNIPQVIRKGNVKSVEKLILQRKDEVPVPALLFRTTANSKKVPGVLYVSSDGKSADAGEDGPISKLLAQGKTVLSIDVRGFGETAASVRNSRQGYFGTDFQTALLGIHLNRPLLGQRTEDVLAALNYLASIPQIDVKRIEIIGVGQCGPVALHAAAFDKRVSKVTLVRSIKSWTDVVADPLGRDRLTNVVPFALESYDLPDLERAIASRTTVVHEPGESE
ncbi:MAG: acetylxylan esterase [Planctomycetes bacterium]|nr:acetylxylan esterase [Planctomycetota bacterium]